MAEKATVVGGTKTCILYSDGTIKIKDVRLSYPHVFKKYAPPRKPSDTKEPVPAFSTQGLLHKETREEDIKVLRNFARKMLKTELKNKEAELPDEKLFIRKADQTKPESMGHWVVSARESTRPTVVGKDGRTPLTEDDGVIYAGCHAHILIRPWFQGKASGYGMRVNANLLAIQFHKDDEAFGNMSRPNIEDIFESEDEDDTANAGASESLEDDGFDDIP
jgi:hypothetical protein